MSGTVQVITEGASGTREAVKSLNQALNVNDANSPSEKTYIAWIYADDTTTDTLTVSVENTSGNIDLSLFDPAKGSITVVIGASSTAGDIDIDVSRDGVEDWVQSHTVPYAATGNVIIPLSDVGYGLFMRMRVTSSAGTGTIKAFVMARGA